MRPILYAVFVLLGVSTTVWLILFRAYPRYLKDTRTPLFTRGRLGAVIAVAILCSILGARASYTVFQWELYAGNPARILRLWEGGLIFHGGLAGALLGVGVFTRVQRIGLRELLDMALPYVCIGYAIGRIGCFLNGCCAGQPSELPWAVILAEIIGTTPRHPTQLYASLAAIAIFVPLRSLSRNARYVGTTTAAFLMLFGGYRFLMEFLRLHRPPEGGLSPFQWTAMLLIILGVGVLVAARWRGERRNAY